MNRIHHTTRSCKPKEDLMKRKMKSKFVSELFEPENKATILSVFRALLKEGYSPKEARKEILDMLDELIDFDELVEGPTGEVLEALDRPVMRMVIMFLTMTARRKTR